MNSVVPDPPFCTDVSLQAHEPLAGTATPTTAYLLLEYHEAWGRKALEESQVPIALQNKLKKYLQSNPQAKTLLIRSHRSLLQPGIHLFAVRLAEGANQVYNFHVPEYEDLLDVDLEAVLSGSLEYRSYSTDSRLVLVCVNGRRDRCCAKFGVAVFEAALQAARDDPEVGVWQCSHIGGHRFAANLITLPAGLVYGRVRPVDVPAILSADREGRIHLPNLRGRSNYPQPAQAAEAALLYELRDPASGPLRLVQFEPLENDAWRVVFATRHDVHYVVNFTDVTTNRRILESCLQDESTLVKEHRFSIQEA